MRTLLAEINDRLYRMGALSETPIAPKHWCRATLRKRAIIASLARGEYVVISSSLSYYYVKMFDKWGLRLMLYSGRGYKIDSSPLSRD